MFLYFECSVRVLWGCCIEPRRGASAMHGEPARPFCVVFLTTQRPEIELGFFYTSLCKEIPINGMPPVHMV